MKVQTKDLIGPALDWVVGDIVLRQSCTDEEVLNWLVEGHNSRTEFNPYSTEWSWGGPIIEQEEVMLLPPLDEDSWTARCGGDAYPGDTPLIAAMRAFVASKLGDTVTVPEELL